MYFFFFQKSQKEATNDVSADKGVIIPQFEYYDGGGHYCRICDETCNTIIQFLTHLHSPKHREVGLDRTSLELCPSFKILKDS